jgi:hypothetical protein
VSAFKAEHFVSFCSELGPCFNFSAVAEYFEQTPQLSFVVLIKCVQKLTHLASTGIIQEQHDVGTLARVQLYQLHEVNL